MSDIGRVKKYEVFLAERQKRDLGGDLENQEEEEEDYKEQKMRNTVEVIKYK